MRKKLFLFCLTISLILLSGCDKKYEEISKEDKIVEKAIAYIKGLDSYNPKLLTKLLDDNDNSITVADLTNDEKMFLTIKNYGNDNDESIFDNGKNKINLDEEELKGVIFEDSSFINSYKEDKQYTIENSIKLKYENNQFMINLKRPTDENKSLYIDILEAKKNDNQLIITFKAGYILYEYSKSNLTVNVYDLFASTNSVKKLEYEKNENGIYPVVEIGPLEEENFKSYSYTLKIDNDNLYYDKIDKLN